VTLRFAWAALFARAETRLLLGLLTVTGGVGLFAKLASEVREGETGAFDRLVLLAFRTQGQLGTPIGPRWLQESARDITALGGFTVLTLISLLAVALLLVHRRRRQAVVFAAAVILAETASDLLKHWAGRARPDLVPHLDLVYSASFPSGHSMMSPVVYLTLAGVLASGERVRAERVLMIGGAALLVALIGVSRVYLGVHWPTDVLGGWVLGLVFALAAIWALALAGGPAKAPPAPVSPEPRTPAG
jgi:undecaprenyl-diphosphatase